MKRKNALLAGVALAVAVGGILPVSAQVKSYKDIKYPSLNEIVIPNVQKVELANGMKLYLVEDHELPIINLSARIRVGSIFEPADKVGLAGITGEVMRTGGTATRTGDELDDELESLAASVETSIGETSGRAFMSVLKEDIDVGVAILADVLMNPEFRDDKVDLAKVEAKSGISRRNDDPNGIVTREFSQVIYGKDSPFARTIEYDTVENITREDLKAFHAEYFHPNNIMMAVWGDFDADEMKTRLEAAFADWKPAELNLPPVPPVAYTPKSSVSLVAKDDVNQSVIRMGHLGITYDNPDYFAIIIMNRILGSGGFSSRLFQNVRSRKGLAYAVGGGIGSNFEYPGMFQLICSTKSETTMEAIRAMLEEVERMTTEDVTEEEIALAKESFLNAFVFNFDTKSEVVNRIMAYDYYGFPEDFLQKTQSEVQAVTVADVRRVSETYLHPDQMEIVVLGKPDDFDEPLDALGAVVMLDIAIPGPSGEQISEATAEDLQKGTAVMASMVTACGGAAAAKSVENINVKSELVVETPQGAMAIQADITTVYPDRAAMVLVLPFGEMTQVITPEGGWSKSPMGDQPMGESELKDAQAGLFRDWVNLLMAADAGALTVQYLGSEDVAGTAVDVIHVSGEAADAQVKLYVDAATGLPVQQSYQGQTMMGPATLVESFSDWQDVGGVMYPFKTVTTADGKPYLEITVATAEANVAVDEALFTQ